MSFDPATVRYDCHWSSGRSRLAVLVEQVGSVFLKFQVVGRVLLLLLLLLLLLRLLSNEQRVTVYAARCGRHRGGRVAVGAAEVDTGFHPRVRQPSDFSNLSGHTDAKNQYSITDLCPK